MKSIKKKISSPFLIIIVMIPFMIMVLFNISMNIYLDQTAKQQLKNSAASLEILVKRQLVDNALSMTPDTNTASMKAGDKRLATLQDSLKLSKVSLLNSIKKMDIEFLILSADGKVLFPKKYEDSFLNSRIVKKAELVTGRAGDNLPRQFHVGRDKYFAISKTLTIGPDPASLILISSRSSADSVIKMINAFLFCIMLIAIGVSSAIALIVSKSISLPIQRLTEYAKRIGNNEHPTMEEDKSSIEIYELSKSMNEMSRRVKDYDEAQKAFLQNASHELRTPLMSIQGYAEGIMKGVFTDTVKTAEIIREESQRLNQLVEELLTLSRIENNNYEGKLSRYNLTDLMKEYIQRISGYALKEEKVIHFHIQTETIPVNADDGLLSQAVINIISNCIRYAEKEVSVTVRKEGSYAEVSISDDGSGIAQEDLPHIFERFYKGKKGNFGLGLSIAKSAIGFMGGNISVFNRNGAVFVIRLPLA